MLDTKARKNFDKLFDKAGGLFLSWNLKPNHITAAALGTGLAAGATLYLGHPILASGILWFSGFLDAVDGSMARQSKTSSLFGALLDILADRIVELAIFWALALRSPSSLFAILGLVSAVLLSITVFLTTGMLADKTGQKSFYYQPGLMERSEGFIASTCMMLFQSHLAFLAWVYAGLVFITMLQRLWQAKKLLASAKIG